MIDFFEGCQYVVSHTKRWNAEKEEWDDVPIRCGKIPGEQDDHCPKHRLFVEDEKLDARRKEDAKILKRNLKTLENEALAASPLRAVNEEYKNKKSASWMEGTGYEA